ncbi:MAG: phenylalanine--tRNA ligase subunit alpha [Desulfurococcales archaeon]|nr:phenylalanine--tRNA ligase subunit alpha [Desulfurococcales archaeon]
MPGQGGGASGPGRIPVSEGEYRLLQALARAGVSRGSLEELERATGIPRSSIASLAALLAEKGLARVEAVEEVEYKPSERGRRILEEGAPEERLVRLIAERGGEADLASLASTLGPEAGVAIGEAKRLGLIEVSGGKARLAVEPGEALERASRVRRLLEALARGGRLEPEELEALKRRGLVEESRRKRLIVELAASPLEVLSRVSVEIGRLTHEMLKSGAWRGQPFRAYNVRAEPPRVLPARMHFLAEFIEMLRDIMKEMGFREVRGPLVELELYNFDMLFQAQDHPAREIHDTLKIAEPREASLEGLESLLERVGRVHERGWGYKWDPRVAARLVLRSQTTSVSARLLASRPPEPLRAFTIGRVFRSDTVDATHLPQFHQLDGVEGWSGYTFRDLLGTLKEISERLGLEVRFKPAYFPFTEPSVEGYAHMPGGGWVELFGAGLFRPEVLEMAGVDYPVGAWGLGVERLAAAYYGIRDIRLLYTRDYDYIRSMPARRGW